MDQTTDAPRCESSQYIAKKELLAKTGISYGQLYRWKREGLIPEEWFEKRSSYTGQETFLPRERTLERVKAIQALKDELSLSEIRERLDELQGEAELRKALLAIPDMDEGFINSLDLDLDQMVLTESSLIAVRTLASALHKAGARQAVQQRVIRQVIEALNLLDTGTPKHVPSSAPDTQ
jgi:DNA-binding transcriptional MerR regulator